jgi:hypothetical protein
MKLLVIMTFMFGSVISVGHSQDEDRLEKTDKASIILNNYYKENKIEVLRKIEDPYLRFLTVIDEFLYVRRVLSESRGSGTINIGFTGRNGIEYDSGLSPEAIDDLVDRESYKKLLAVNNENIKTLKKLLEIRKNLDALSHETVKKLDGKYQKMAVSMIEKL